MAIDKAVDSTVLDGYFSDIADAIRSKNGESGTYTPAQMPAKITAIPSGGGDNLPARVDGSLTSFSDNTITTVCAFAFYYCQNLETVSLPAVTYIDGNAFNSCPKLKSVSIPSATEIETSAFSSTATQVATADKTNLDLPNVSVIRGSAFYGCGFIKDLTLPVITDIYNNAFQSSSVENLTIGGDNFTARSSIFSQCTSLVSAIFTKNVSSINQNAFKNCTNCLLYDFSNCTAVPTLDNTNAFYNINANAKIVVPDSLYNTWIAASNWSNYASYIIKKTDYDAL